MDIFKYFLNFQDIFRDTCEINCSSQVDDELSTRR